MSAATYAEIKGWFDEGVANGHRYMVVWCDQYDWSDYPSYHDTEGDTRKDLATNGTNMKRLMEVYDLAAERDAQLSQHRCMALRP